MRCDCIIKTHEEAKSATDFNLLGLAILALLWFYAMAWALSGNMLYRAQHFGAALIYYNQGIDLLRPVIPGFNATGTGTPQEFPFWQAAAACALKLTGGWWPAVTVITLGIFSACCLAWWRLGNTLDDVRSGGLVLAMLLFQPLVFHHAGLASVDGFSLAMMLLFVWQAENLRRRPTIANVFLCCLFTTLLALTKLPFLLAAAIGACWVLLWSKQGLRSWVQLAACGAVAAIIFYFWNRWCEQEILSAEFRYRQLMLKEVPHWFFGTLSMRLDPMVYIKGGWRSLNALWGSFFLVGLTIYGIYRAPKSLGVGLLLGALATTMVFFNLVLVHRHYYLMFAPAIALINAAAVRDLFDRIPWRSSFQKLFGLGAMGVLFLLALGQGLLGIEVILCADPYWKRVGINLAEYVSPHEKVVIVNGGWGAPYVVSGRTYLSVDDTRLATNPETRKRLLELGFTKIAFLGESELLHSLQITNPGQTNKKRLFPQALVCEETASWPVIFESDELIIKEIPQE